MKSFFRYSGVMAIALLLGAAHAGDVDSIVADCNGCHGDNGVSEWDDVPTIAGMSEIVHIDALYFYRDEARPCENSEYRQGDLSCPATNMCDVAKKLSKDDIDAVAAHYAALKFVPAKQKFDPALANTGETVHLDKCDRCHSEGGSNPDDEAGILAGQWMGYMKRSFAEYFAGKREQPKKMKEKMDQLSEKDVEALLHYYASQQ